MFGKEALCLGRVLGNDSARAESCLAKKHSTRAKCSGTILIGLNRVWPRGILLGQSVATQVCSGKIMFGQWAFYSGRVLGNDSAWAESCLAKRHSARAECLGKIMLELNPVGSFLRVLLLPLMPLRGKFSNKMFTEDLLELIREYPLPKGWYARLPGLQEPANYGTKFDTGIYEEQVKSGYRLPLHPFALHFFEHYHMAPGQLVPNGWRKFVRLIYLV
ncbi:hypothetical protein RJ639_032395 [Escallonia herrerae]|uniref:Transposase (putative) gypsy type domain-containing protein n=1 Tax=Escallonia herrerae TaxID=1293975 RepID=A0AA89BE78_9ASTE|nr:hypothetical protein RJ639_032395 [Escallonia herrerae]